MVINYLLGPECSGKDEAIIRVNYIPILSSETALHIKKPAIVRNEKSGHGPQMGARHQDRLAD
jgi:hypothetical protein